MKTMIAKYPGTCRACGESIVWSRSTGALHESCHQCEQQDMEEFGEDEAAGLEPGTLANDRRLAKRGLSVIRFSSGAVMTQNSRGRCEDAPCCGCCT